MDKYKEKLFVSPDQDRFQRWSRDLSNRLKYGSAAPRVDELLWADPEEITLRYHASGPKGGPDLSPYFSGLVLDGDWDSCVGDVRQMLKHKSCILHFVDGVPWEQTPVHDHLMGQIAAGDAPDNCRSLADLKARYAQIDRLFLRLEKQGAVHPRSTLPNPVRGEYGGIHAHVDRNGNFVRFRNGNHRFAIACILDFPVIPIHVGVVHPLAIESGAYERLRLLPDERREAPALASDH